MSMNIYISGPMTGLDPSVIRTNFEVAENRIREKFPETDWIANPAKLLDFTDGLTYEQCLSVDLEQLARCDAIYMLKGWQNSKGCNRGYGFALGRDMVIVEEE